MKNQIVLLFSFFVLTHANLHCKPNPGKKEKFSNTKRIENDLSHITKTNGFRNFKNIEVLNLVADYIFKELNKTCDTVYFQTFSVNGKEYKNVVGSIGIDKKDRIVVGAHYDVAGDQEGADDNASGVSGLLELSRIIAVNPIKHRIDFVCYSLEEPPFFGTENMGSYIHAKSLHDDDIEIKGMICLEMIGYFSEKENSQDFPRPFLKYFYGNKGNFITIVQKFGNGKFGRKVNRIMKKYNLIRTKSFKAPMSVEGVDFSDHRNYWRFGYSAVMITNTSFYRNYNYHQPEDKMETLDIFKMGLVIDELYLTLREIK